MAINVQQIDPLDLTPFVGVGVDLPFSGTAVFNTTYQTKDAIKANLINYFLTNKGERYLNVNFGSDIRLLLFDNITQEKLERIKNTVEEEIKSYFPRVRQVEFQINSSPDTNLVTVHYRYRIVNTNIEDEVVINIEQ
jgi:phage baseplate assembly protein W